MEIQMHWKGGLKFTGTSIWGHEIVIDSSKKSGGNEEGYQPMELMIFGLAACTGIDIVRISDKMRLELTDLDVKVKITQAEEPPREVTAAHIEYVVTGKDIKPSKIEKAIDLSVNKYCTVGATMRGITEITHSYTIKEV